MATLTKSRFRKACSKCHVLKNIDEFYDGNGEFGKRARCIECFNAAGTMRYYDDVESSRDSAKVHAKTWRVKHPEQSRELSRSNQRRHVRALRELIFSTLGNRCSCGFSDIRAIHIDHKSDNGHTDKNVFNGNKTAYLNYVLAFSQLFQLLCANCNHRKIIASLPEPSPGRATWSRQYDQRLRGSAIAALGSKCCRCPEHDPVVLCIDHKKSCGRRDRSYLGGSQAMYRDVLRRPSRYQLLCHNCNWIKRHECQEWHK